MLFFGFWIDQFPFQNYFSFLYFLQTIDAAKQCAFAASGRTHNHHNLPSVYRETDVIKNGKFLELFFQMLYL